MERTQIRGTGAPAGEGASWLPVLLSRAGMLAPLWLAGAVVLSSFATTEYSQLSGSISQLGAQQRAAGQIMDYGFPVYGLLSVAFGLGLRGALGATAAGRTAGTAVVFHGAYAVLLGPIEASFQTPDATGNLEGALHIYLARLSFICLLVAMVAASRHFGRRGRRRLAAFSLADAGFCAGAGAVYAFGLIPELSGLIQRVFLTAASVWFVVMSVAATRAGAPARAVDSQPLLEASRAA